MKLSNSQYNLIMREYANIRTKNRLLHDNRRKEIEKASPDYLSLTSEIGEISHKAALNALSPDKNNLGSYHKKIKVLEEKRIKLLTELGKPKEYLDPIYDCPLCQDTGIRENANCSCFLKKAVDILYRDTNLISLVGDSCLDDFNLDIYSNEADPSSGGISDRMYASKALDSARDFVAGFDDSFENLLIYGGTGVGKTHLSTCIAGELLGINHSIIYISASDFFDILINSNDNPEYDSDPYSAKISHKSSHLTGCDLLIIDDLGTEYSNSLTVSKLFSCLNTRIINKKNTIISTNLDLRAIAGTYTERIYSRIIANFTPILLCSKQDLRTRKYLD